MWNRAAIASLLLLTGCATGPQPPGSVAHGTCEIVRAPEYAVRGRTGYDQAWVNKTTEALVDGCLQPRPKARPKELDAPKQKQTPKAKAVAQNKAKAKPKAKANWWQKRPAPKPKAKPPEFES